MLQPLDRLIPEPRTPVGARDIPAINWGSLLRKAIKGKGPLHPIDTREGGGDQQIKDTILDNLEALINERRQEIARKLMADRDSTVRAWKDELEGSEESYKYQSSRLLPPFSPQKL